MFWGKVFPGEGFQNYSFEHFAVLLGIFIFYSFVFYFMKKNNSEKYKKIFRYSQSFTMILFETLLVLWYIDTGKFKFGESLPLELCRVSAILCAILLIKENKYLFEIVYFWGLAGATAALLSPFMAGYGFPHVVYLKYFINHSMIISTVVFMMLIEGYRINIKSFIRVIGITLMYIIFILNINKITGGNYLYLSYSPSKDNFLSIFGENPGYLIKLTIFGSFLMFVLYTPFIIKKYSKKLISREKI